MNILSNHHSEIISLIYVISLAIVVTFLFAIKKSRDQNVRWVWLSLFFTAYTVNLLAYFLSNTINLPNIIPFFRIILAVVSALFLAGFMIIYIAENQKLEKEKKLSELKLLQLSKAVEQSPAGILITDKSGVIEYVNPKFSELSGYPAQELLGKTPSILGSGTTKREVYKELWQTINSGSEWRGELQNRKKSGELYWDSISISPVKDETGKITHFVTVEQDITENKKMLEAMILAKDEADHAASAKSEFLANMSHELRTPLNSIIGISDLLSETKNEAKQAEYISIMKKASNDLLTLINDILDFSKIEANKVDIAYSYFSLEDIVQQVIEVLSPQADKKGLKLSYRIGKDVMNYLIGDSHKVRQILNNLAGNAIKFTPKGSVIVSIDNYVKEKNESTLLFCVEDTGIGIAEKKLKSVFESFSQGDSGITKQFGGSGLGLTISQRLVNLMGGKIWVESKEGSGSKFFFTAAFKYQEDHMSCDSKTIDGHILKVMVFDEEETSRLRVYNALQKNGLAVSEAVNWEEAETQLISAAKENLPFDAVIASADGEGSKAGVAIIEKIRQELKLAGTKIILMLNERNPEILSKIRLFDAQYLFKPVLISYLYRAIDSIIKEKNEEIANKAQGAVKPAAQKPLRILIAEDSEDNRALINLYLKSAGHKLEMAENGAVAVDKYKADKFDVILMDLHMPVMDGFTATELIRKYETENSKPRVPIVALSADVLKEAADRCLVSGCDLYLTKPIKKATLLEVIRRYQS